MGGDATGGQAGQQRRKQEQRQKPQQPVYDPWLGNSAYTIGDTGRTRSGYQPSVSQEPDVPVITPQHSRPMPLPRTELQPPVSNRPTGGGMQPPIVRPKVNSQYRPQRGGQPVK